MARSRSSSRRRAAGWFPTRRGESRPPLATHLRVVQARNSLTERAPNARALLAHGLLTGEPRAMRTESDSESDLYRAVVAYLDENPEAMDTLEGIAEWWVMRQRVRSSVSTVAFVVRQLVEDGLLEEVGPRERPCFRLKRAFQSGRGTQGH